MTTTTKRRDTYVEDKIHCARMDQAMLDFWRPHRRVQFDGQLVNHKTGEVFTPPRRVKQSFVQECDINNILKQYSAAGQLKHISAKAAQGAYQDLPDELDFQTAMNTVIEAQTAFASLPSKTRDRFGNDPANFLEFMADPKNAKEAVELGLATARADSNGAMQPPKEPPQAPTAAPAAPKPPEGS